MSKASGRYMDAAGVAGTPLSLCTPGIERDRAPGKCLFALDVQEDAMRAWWFVTWAVSCCAGAGW